MIWRLNEPIKTEFKDRLRTKTADHHEYLKHGDRWDTDRNKQLQKAKLKPNWVAGWHMRMKIQSVPYGVELGTIFWRKKQPLMLHWNSSAELSMTVGSSRSNPRPLCLRLRWSSQNPSLWPSGGFSTPWWGTELAFPAQHPILTQNPAAPHACCAA